MSLLIFLVFNLNISSLEAQVVVPIKSPSVEAKAVRVIEKQGLIWAMDFIDKNSLIFTERSGKIKILDLKTKKITKVTSVPEVMEIGQGGLLDVHLDPDFSKNKKIYLTYSIKVEKDNYTTVLSSATLQGSKLVGNKVIFQVDPSTDNHVHFGSRIQFDGEGHIFFSVGDRGERELAQDISKHPGKVLRLTLDGKAPKDNPFINNPKAKPEIWSYGNRNIQGLFYDIKTKTLYANEHGPRGGDEINIIKKGANYGWPTITYGREYYGPKIGEGNTKAGIENPLYQFTPSIAPSGLVFYSGKMIPAWKDSFFTGALALTHLNRVYLQNGKYFEERFLSNISKRIRNVKESPDGSLFLSTDSGDIYQIIL